MLQDKKDNKTTQKKDKNAINYYKSKFPIYKLKQ